MIIFKINEICDVSSNSLNSNINLFKLFVWIELNTKFHSLEPLQTSNKSLNSKNVS